MAMVSPFELMSPPFTPQEPDDLPTISYPAELPSSTTEVLPPPPARVEPAGGSGAFTEPPAGVDDRVDDRVDDEDVMGRIKKATGSLLADTAANNAVPFEPDANPDGSLNQEAATRNMGAAQKAMGKALERPTAALEPYLPDEERKGLLAKIQEKMEAATDTPQFNWSELEEDEKSSLLLRLGLNMMAMGGQEGAAQQGLIGVLGAAGQATLDDWDKKAERQRRSKEAAIAEELKAERDLSKEDRAENRDIRSANRAEKIAVAKERRGVLDSVDKEQRTRLIDMEKAATKHGYNISLEGIRQAHRLSSQAHANSLGIARDKLKEADKAKNIKQSDRFDKETLGLINLVQMEHAGEEWSDAEIAKEVSRRQEVRYGGSKASGEDKAIAAGNAKVVTVAEKRLTDLRKDRKWRRLSDADKSLKTDQVYEETRQRFITEGVFPENYTFAQSVENASMSEIANMYLAGDSLSVEKAEALHRRRQGLSLQQKQELKSLLQQGLR